MTPLIFSHLATWVLLILLTLAVLALYRHFGQLYMNTRENKSAQGPALGSSILSLGEKGLDGQDVFLPDGRPTVMVFADTDCEHCAQIRDELIQFEAGSVRFVLLCSGRKSDVVAWARPPRRTRRCHLGPQVSADGKVRGQRNAFCCSGGFESKGSGEINHQR